MTSDPSAPLLPRLRLADLNIGRQFITAGRTITVTDIINFAGLSGDFDELHMSDVAARRSSYGTRIAHGLCVLSIASGQLVRSGVFHGIDMAFLGLSVDFLRPTPADTTIVVRATVSDMHQTSDAKRYVLSLGIEVMEQKTQQLLARGMWKELVSDEGSDSDGQETRPAAVSTEIEDLRVRIRDLGRGHEGVVVERTVDRMLAILATLEHEVIE